MPVGIRACVLGNGSFELRSPISLQHLDASRKAPDPGRLQKNGTIATGQCGPEHDIGLFGVNVEPREGEDAAECHGIHLYDRPGSCRRWDNTPFLILAPFRADHVFLRQNLIDFWHGEPDLILPFQEIRELLPTQSCSRTRNSQISRLIDAETWRASRGPFLACVWRSRKPESPYVATPLSQSPIVSRFRPQCAAIFVRLRPCSASSKASVMCVNVCMSIGYYGLSDIYENIAVACILSPSCLQRPYALRP
jgi:hypothetical protein